MSFAASGRASRIASTALMISGRSEGVLARLPVAGAELVGLQRVEDADHLVDVASDGKVGRRNGTDDAVRIDDVGHADRGAGLRMQDADFRRERRSDVDERRRQLAKVVVM